MGSKMISAHKICYETHGDRNNPCIVLIMGIGGQLIDWPTTFTQGLADKGFYVVTFDNRDSGLSRSYDELGVPNLHELAKHKGKPMYPPYTLEDMAQDVITLMDDLHIEKAHILGGSMGGIIAQYVALNFTDRVLSLICIGTTSGDKALPPPQKEVLDFFSTLMISQNQPVESIINNKLKLFKIYSHPDYFDEDNTRNQLMTAFNRANNPAGFKRLMLAMVCAEPRTDKLKQLKLPSLIIHGDYDPAFSLEHGKQLAECIVGSHLEIIEKMGHGIHEFFCNKMVESIAKHVKINQLHTRHSRRSV